jgi:hypothetical protein
MPQLPHEEPVRMARRRPNGAAADFGPSRTTMNCRILCMLMLVPVATRSHARESCTVISLKDDYKRATAVFVGESLRSNTGTAHFRVIQTLKGQVGPEVILDSTQFQRFLPGLTYLVFSYSNGAGPAYIHDCSHTNPVNHPFAREVQVISRRSRWWNCPISSLPWRRRPGVP